MIGFTCDKLSLVGSVDKTIYATASIAAVMGSEVTWFGRINWGWKARASTGSKPAYCRLKNTTQKTSPKLKNKPWEPSMPKP